MARVERPREDLMREATGLVHRVEFTVDEFGEPVVAGFRRNGCASIFVGSDPVIQFNMQQRFRRGFIDGTLYKAEGGRLVALHRECQAGKVVMLPSEPDAAEAQRIVSRIESVMDLMRCQLEDSRFQIIRQVPDDADVMGEFVEWLGNLSPKLFLAASPHAR